MAEADRVKIVHEGTVANSKAFVFILEEFVKTVKAGFADHELAFGNSANITYALDGEQVIGACAWHIDTTKRAAWILFSAVAEERRQQGVYKRICKAVELKASLAGAVALYSGVHVKNDPMIAAAQSSGRELGWYRTKKVLV